MDNPPDLVAMELRRQLVFHWEQLRAIAHKVSLEIELHRQYGQELLEVLRFEVSLSGNPQQIHISRGTTENTELEESQKRSARLLRHATCVLSRYHLVREIQQEWVVALVVSNGVGSREGWRHRPPLWLYQKIVPFSSPAALLGQLWTSSVAGARLTCQAQLEESLKEANPQGCVHCTTTLPAVDEDRWTDLSQEIFDIIRSGRLPAYLVSEALGYARWILQRRLNYGQCLGCRCRRERRHAYCCIQCRDSEGVEHTRQCPERQMRFPYTYRYEGYRHHRISWE